MMSFGSPGSQFDEKGNLRLWWSKQSLNNYKNRSKCMEIQYNNTYVYGKKVSVSCLYVHAHYETENYELVFSINFVLNFEF